jgi:hypothetical protein
VKALLILAAVTALVATHFTVESRRDSAELEIAAIVRASVVEGRKELPGPRLWRAASSVAASLLTGHGQTVVAISVLRRGGSAVSSLPAEYAATLSRQLAVTVAQEKDCALLSEERTGMSLQCKGVRPMAYEDPCGCPLFITIGPIDLRSNEPHTVPVHLLRQRRWEAKYVCTVQRKGAEAVASCESQYPNEAVVWLAV